MRSELLAGGVLLTLLGCGNSDRATNRGPSGFAQGGGGIAAAEVAGTAGAEAQAGSGGTDGGWGGADPGQAGASGDAGAGSGGTGPGEPGGRAGTAGAAEIGGEGGTSGGGGGAGGIGGSPANASAICPRNSPLGTPIPLLLELAPAARFAAATPDERTLIWTLQDVDALTVYYVDRATTTATFGTERAVAVDSVDEQVAVRSDGLMVVYVAADGQSFAALTRPTRDSEFSPAAAAGFEALNQALLAPGEKYAEPVYGPPEGGAFYYGIRDAQGTRTHFAATQLSPGDAFLSIGTIPLGSVTDTRVARLSGVSADQQVLFLWDPDSGQTTARFFDWVALAYQDAMPLGALGPVQPNAACSSLYAGVSPGRVARVPWP